MGREEAGDPRRIAILGGGLAGLATAFELTATAELRARHQVTVYQMGWRLGGKCASSRGRHGRIEEHGLHVLLGSYENAFELLRRLYDELDRPAGAKLARFEDAFLPHDEVVFVETIGETLRPWTVRFPRNARRPGDGGLWPAPADYLAMAVGGLRDGARALVSLASRRLAPRAWSTQGSAGARLLLGLTLEPVAAALRARQRGDDDALSAAVDALVAALVDHLHADDELRRLVIFCDLAAAVARGIVADDLAQRGFAAIDDEDFRAWLRRHGARTLSVESALLRGLYDLVFHAPADGRPQTGFAAGTALRMTLRFVAGYKGAIGWWMAAGTGETLVAPLYEVLAARGVQFAFFHRVRGLELAADSDRLAAVHLGVQAQVRAGAYSPLERHDGLPCWPDRPRYDQLVEGEALRARGVDLESSWTDWQDVGHRTLEVGRDVDEVVLAISLAALPAICAPLAERSQRWRAMFAAMHTTPTLALQLWSQSPRPPREGKPMMNTGVAPLTGYGDMSHLLVHEGWREGERPGHVLHVCSRVEAPAAPPPGAADYDSVVDRFAHDEGLAWLQGGGASVVPGAGDPGKRTGPVWSALHDPEGRVGPARFEAAYWRCNVEPSDRYVLSVPGSGKTRLRADESGFAHLTLAGAWTRTGLDVGSVEAAMTSGKAASRALCGVPERIYGESDWK